MEIRVIVFVLILDFVFGLYITEGKNKTEVYEVKEGKTRHSLTITNPKPDEPTLREILYYHIIETPYEQKQGINEHNSIAGERDLNRHEKQDSFLSIDNELVTNKDNIIRAYNNEQSNAEHDTTRNGIIIKDEQDVAHEKELDNNEEKEFYSKGNQRHFTNGHGFQYFSTDPENQDNPAIPAVPFDDNNVTDGDSNQKPASPDKIEDHYLNKRTPANAMESNDNTTAHSEDPINPDENTDKNLDKDEPAEPVIPIEDDQKIDPDSQNDTAVSDENAKNDLVKVALDPRRKREIEDKIVGTKQKPETSILEEALSIIQLRNKKSLKNEGKTYGMSLTGDRGVVWNDLNNMKFSFPVGATSNEVEDTKYDNEIILRARHADDNDQETNNSLRKTANNLEDATSIEELNHQEPSIRKRSSEKLSSERAYRKKLKYEQKDKPSKRTMSDDEEINSKIETFEKELGKAALEDFKIEKPSREILSTRAPIIVVPGNKKPITRKPITEEPGVGQLNTKKPTRTYGISLIGDHGMVWNDLNGRRVAYHVGDSTGENEESSSADDPVFKTSKDDKEINAKIETFKKDLKEIGSKDKSNNKETSTAKQTTKKQTTEKPITSNPTTEKPQTEKPSTKKPSREISSTRAPIIVVPSTKKPSIVGTSTRKPIIKEPSVGEPNTKKPTKTYGISLTGDHGTVWNDLNGQRVAYHVGDSTGENEESSSADYSLFKTSKVDKEINAKIEKFEKVLKEIGSKDKSNNKVKTKHSTAKPTTKELTTKKPVMSNPTNEKPKTEEPITNKPTTEKTKIAKPTTKQPITNKPTTVKTTIVEPVKSAKTYGMSLNGDHGLVWNDLNGHRMSYHVGELTMENEENTHENQHDGPKTTEKPNLDGVLNHILEPSDSNTEIAFDIDKAYEEIDKIFGIAEETKKPQNNTDLAIVNEIADIIKEVFENETAKLEEKISNCSNSDGNDKNSKDEGSKKEDDYNKITTFVNTKIPNQNEEQFWKWLDEWSTAYTELMMNRIDTHIKKEVTKQIEEFFTTHEHATELATNNNEDHYTIDSKKDLEGVDVNETSSVKKRKDKDSENKNIEKEPPVKIEAKNVYGNSVGNGNVTNIFVFNIRNISDIDSIKALSNGSNGIYVFGHKEKPVGNNDSATLQENKDKADGQTTQNPNGSLSNIPHNYEVMGTTEKTTTKPIEENTHDETSENQKEKLDSTTKKPENKEPTEKDDNVKDKLNGQKIGDKDNTTEHTSNSSNNYPEGHEIKDTTEKATPKPVFVDEKPSDETTENPKETVESLTKLPEKEDSQEKNKENIVSHEHESNTTDKTNDYSKDTTLEKSTPQPNAEKHSHDQTTETSKENVEFTSLRPEKEDSKENEKNKDSSDANRTDDKSKSEDSTSENSKEVKNEEPNKVSESEDQDDTDKNDLEEEADSEEDTKGGYIHKDGDDTKPEAYDESQSEDSTSENSKEVENEETNKVSESEDQDDTDKNDLEEEADSEEDTKGGYIHKDGGDAKPADDESKSEDSTSENSKEVENEETNKVSESEDQDDTDKNDLEEEADSEEDTKGGYIHKDVGDAKPADDELKSEDSTSENSKEVENEETNKVSESENQDDTDKNDLEEEADSEEDTKGGYIHKDGGDAKPADDESKSEDSTSENSKEVENEETNKVSESEDQDDTDKNDLEEEADSEEDTKGGYIHKDVGDAKPADVESKSEDSTSENSKEVENEETNKVSESEDQDDTGKNDLEEEPDSEEDTKGGYIHKDGGDAKPADDESKREDSTSENSKEVENEETNKVSESEDQDDTDKNDLEEEADSEEDTKGGYIHKDGGDAKPADDESKSEDSTSENSKETKGQETIEVSESNDQDDIDENGLEY